MGKKTEASDLYHQILERYWGYTRFRPLQEEIIFSVANGHDTLALMPTGGGKSVTFQVPALAKEGICLVITPLIALMKDQVARLRKMDIKAAAIFSGMTREEIDITLDNCIYGDYKFLYVSPERLTSDLFRVRVERMNVNLITVDEAHCISQWGYDFRPSYLRIAALRELLPEVPVLALTATATPDVVDDIQEKLLFRRKNVLRSSFFRSNLAYVVRHTDDKEGYLLQTLSKVKGQGIVYVRTRKYARDLTLTLREHGLSADLYHAGLSHELRDAKQEAWTRGTTRIIVATNAFGMGIDKPDVRFVIHMDPPDSLEAYFQEAGRAGRDGKKAWAVLLFHEADEQRFTRRARTNFPEIDEIKRVYEALGNYFQLPVGAGKNMAFDFDLSDFVSRYHFNVLTAYNSLKILEREGYIEFAEDVHNPSRVHFTVNRDELYKFQIANEKFDAFIKLLLRTYTGLFTEYVPIREEQLARQAGVPAETIVTYLKRLSQLHIIRYIPGRESPMIIFTEERLDNKNLRISREHYALRKEIYQKKQAKVVEYARNSTLCRSRFLLSYFGEENSPECGICDICRTKKEKADSPDEDTVTLYRAVVRLLDDHPEGLPPDRLATLEVLPPERHRQALRRLTDNGYLTVNPATGKVKKGKKSL